MKKNVHTTNNFTLSINNPPTWSATIIFIMAKLIHIRGENVTAYFIY